MHSYMTKLDFKKAEKELYSPPSDQPVIIEIPTLTYLMLDGKGDPNDKEFGDAVQTLYAVAYGIKMLPKKGITPNGYAEYVVPPLSGLWWAKDMQDFMSANRDNWQWTAMIRQPEFVTEKLVEQVKQQVVEKKKELLRVGEVRLESYKEGKCVQIMHLGPYSAEAPTIQKLHQFAADQGFKLRGKHHEIYLSDPRKAKPEKMKTVIRQPVK